MDLSASNLSHSCQVWKTRRPWIVRRVRDLNTENEKKGRTKNEGKSTLLQGSTIENKQRRNV